MKRVGKFEKVSFKQFKKDWLKAYDKNDKASSIVAESVIQQIYDKITLPVRATVGSAGYDFVSPLSFKLEPREEILIPTGIRCQMEEDWMLMMSPRSSLGFKYKLMFCNTTGIIDASYYHAENEGHIYAKLVNFGDYDVYVSAGDRFCQGVFLQYGITYDDDVVAKRIGGLGCSGY